MASEAYPLDSFRQERELEPNLCFLICPFGDEFSDAVDAIVNVVEGQQLTCVRADSFREGGTVHSDIWISIQRAALIIADITSRNPNVMLELGVAFAVKEQFRIILIDRHVPNELVPFDLHPFRRIEYETTAKGINKLHHQLREAIRSALTQNPAIPPLVLRMQDWEKANHSYSLLVGPETLARLRADSTAPGDDGLRGFLLAAAVQHGVDLDWWAEKNQDNKIAAEVAVEILLGGWLRPAFRAAYVLQRFAPALKARAIEAARRLSQAPISNRLIDALETGTVVEFTTKETSGLITESERYEILRNLTPVSRVRLD